MYNRKLDDLPLGEQLIVIAICALVDMLDGDMESYAPVISWVLEHEFGGVPGHGRGEKTKGFLEKHEPRARERWQ